MPRRSKRSSREEDEEVEVEAEFNDDEMIEEEQEEEENNEDGTNSNDDDEEEDEGEEESRGVRAKSRKANKKKQRVKVMSASNQTDEERRILRSKQRKLLSKMTDASTDIGEKMGDVDSEVFQNVRKENNKLWKHVLYTREAVLDGDNVHFISERAARQTDKLVTVSRNYSVQCDLLIEIL